MSQETDPRYPIGRFSYRPETTAEDRSAYIEAIADAPGALRVACQDLSPSQLDTPYRNGGWTPRQVVHHVFDSHCNAWIRFRLALTEDHPRVTAYQESMWAELPDTFEVPINVSLNLLDGLHERLVVMLRHLDTADWKRTLDHPENGSMTVDMLLQMYAWHGAHHIAHITRLRERNGW